MKTAVEYLALSERYRIAKLSTHDAATQDQLEIFERSYFLHLLMEAYPAFSK